MQKLNDLSRSLTALEPDGTLIAVIEMSLSSWLVAGIVLKRSWAGEVRNVSLLALFLKVDHDVVVQIGADREWGKPRTGERTIPFCTRIFSLSAENGDGPVK